MAPIVLEVPVFLGRAHIINTSRCKLDSNCTFPDDIMRVFSISWLAPDAVLSMNLGDPEAKEETESLVVVLTPEWISRKQPSESVC